jgi:uncharacterized protein YbdZ (MbtH family)
MTAKELQEILKLHKMWLNDNEKGVKANLKWTDLTGADLRGADLKDANLKWADLRWADLTGADLRWADLTGADLNRANLNHANLEGANLTNANLDYSALPLWCGSKFKADERICKQLVAHTLKIMELSNEGSDELINLMTEYKSGWHREKEF